MIFKFKGKTGQLKLEKGNVMTFEPLSNGTEDLLQIDGLKTLSSQVLNKKAPGLCIFCPPQQK